MKIKGIKGTFPWISLLISIIMIPFVGPLILISLAFAAAGYFYTRGRARTKPESTSANQ